jgi:flagellar biosynthetic protein FlhB
MAQENKTEKATPYRRRKLREEGNVAKSAEIATASTVLLGSILIFFTGYTLFSKVLELFWNVSLNPLVGFHRIFTQIKESIVPLILPFFVLSLLVVILTHIAQFGFIFTTKTLEPKLERLNPFEGLKRIFSLTTLFELTKNLLKVSLLMIVAYFFVRSELWELFNLFASESSSAIRSFLGFTFKLVVFISVIALFIALLDYAYKRWDYERRIRMSKEEVKEEYKQQEGNPLVKGAIRRRMRQLAKGRMLQEVPKASVVITNPTHIAIALRYDPSEGDKAPIILAKGKGEVAERIVEVATVHGVPIVRREELARALYPVVEVGEEIPPKFYRAVAEVIAFVLSRRKRIAV